MISPNEADPPDTGWLLRLRPTARAAGLSPASTPGLLARAGQVVGGEPVLWAVEVGHGMATRIVAEMPGFGGSSEAFEILRMGTESTTIQSLILLAGEQPDAVATAEALDGVTDFVRRGLGLDLVLRGIRLGHAGMSEAFLDACKRLVSPEYRLDMASRVSADLFEFIDAFSANMAERYLQEQVRWSTSDAAAKRELVGSLLRGVRPDITSASRRLGFELADMHVAVVVWSASATMDSDAVQLQDTALSFLRRLRCSQRLVVPVGSGAVWAWGRPPVYGVDAVEDATDGFAVPSGVKIAVGLPGAGIDGFCRSHREAQAACEVVRHSVSGLGTTLYSQVDLVSLLTNDRDRAVEFARRELGGLATDTVQAKDLRETVLTFLDNESSPHATALAMNVARNTVSYRVRRAEELRGAEISVRRTELHAALVITRQFGVLRSAG